MIKLENVSKKYGDVYALNRVNIELPETGLVVLLGSNGSGKSTFINLIGGLIKATEGKLLIDDIDLSALDEKRLSQFREEQVAFIFQDDFVFDNLTVRENIEIVGGKYKTENLVNFLGIEDLLEKKAKELSGGERKKVAIGRAIAKNARILLADEPEASLDVDSSCKIADLLKELGKSKLVIVVSHDMEYAYRYGDIIVRLEGGHLLDKRHRRDNFEQNRVGKVKNKFDVLKFTSKVLLSNKKKIVWNTLLLVITFLALIVTSSIAFIDYKELEIKTALDEKNGVVTIRKKVDWNGYYDSFSYERMTDEDVRFLKNNLKPSLKTETIKSINPGDRGFHGMMSFEYDLSNRQDDVPYYYRFQPALYSLAFSSLDNLGDLLCGKMPYRNNEIVISSFLADIIMEYGVKDSEGIIYKPSNYEEFVRSGRRLNLGGYPVVITGIKDSHTEKIEALKAEETSNTAVYDYNFHLILDEARIIYVRDDFYEMFDDLPFVMSSYKSIKYKDESFSGKVFENSVKTIDEEVIQELNEGEVIINISILNAMGVSPLEIDGRTLKLYEYDERRAESKKLGEFLIKGVSLDDGVYFTKADMEPFIVENIAIDALRIYGGDKRTIEKLLEEYREMHTKYSAYTNYRGLIDEVEENMKNYVIFGGVFTAVLSVLSIIFLRNYIANSIDSHRREVAILKSFGIKKKSIDRLFMCEALIISIISYVISCLLSGLISILVERLTLNKSGVAIPLVSVDIFVIMGVFLAIVVVLGLIVATMLKKIAKITPMEVLKGTQV